MTKEEIRDLLFRYAHETCSIEEKRLLEDMVQKYPLVQKWEWTSEEEKILMRIRIKQQIDQQRFSDKSSLIRRLWPVGLAASILLVASLLLLQNKKQPTNDVRISTTTSLSDNTGIMLTLSDGSIIPLSGKENGIVSNDRGVAIKKLENGQLIYNDIANVSSNNPIHEGASNTIHIPKGKTFELMLSDGTKVWLNAASTLTYPVAFQGEERQIFLTGEAYFEVAHDPKRPFKVMADNNEIRVIGTHFNVSAYPDDGAVTTTLTEGGVIIHKNNTSLKLIPGDQAISYRDQDHIDLHQVDTENSLGWRKGYFVFNDQNIASIMKDVARWYDVEVVFSAYFSNKKFGGTFPKSANINDLLEDLESLGNIKFRRKGKEVIVMQ